MSIEYVAGLPYWHQARTVNLTSAPRLSALYNLIRGASMAVDNNDRVTAKAVLTNAEHMVLAMMENGK